MLLYPRSNFLGLNASSDSCLFQNVEGRLYGHGSPCPTTRLQAYLCHLPGEALKPPHIKRNLVYTTPSPQSGTKRAEGRSRSEAKTAQGGAQRRGEG